jgi:putative methyltransferase (TIGR04325 family)
MKVPVSELVPPALMRFLRVLKTRVRGDWSVSRDGWTDGPGWNVPSVAEFQRAHWADFVAAVRGTAPLDVAGARTIAPDAAMHNTVMAYGYVLGRAAHMRQRVRMLDWGGGLGHYRVLGEALFPDLALDYTCVDLPPLVNTGRELQPDTRFTDDASEALAKRYDLVVASSSLHYSRDWRDVARKLANASDGFVYVTRLPVVERAESFVVRQKAYGTEYCGWFLNRHELIEAFTREGMVLDREFLLGEQPIVPDAPEQARYRGFLFRAAVPAAP